MGCGRARRGDEGEEWLSLAGKACGNGRRGVGESFAEGRVFEEDTKDRE